VAFATFFIYPSDLFNALTAPSSASITMTVPIIIFDNNSLGYSPTETATGKLSKLSGTNRCTLGINVAKIIMKYTPTVIPTLDAELFAIEENSIIIAKIMSDPAVKITEPIKTCPILPA